MRVWLIEEERCAETGVSLEPVLRALADLPEFESLLVGVSGFRPDLPVLLRAGVLHALVINTSAWNQVQGQAELLELGLPILFAGEVKTAETWAGLAGQHVIGFVPMNAGPGEVWSALWSLVQAKRREQDLRVQSERLQQRLSDRIIIEKAKGIVMQRLGVSEDDAYQRLRMQSRRQRKQIREIAQSILDTEMLLDANGAPRMFPSNQRPAEARSPGGLAEVTVPNEIEDLGESTR
jgi:hypothetical protein